MQGTSTDNDENRLEGNKLFKNGDFEGALALYNQSLVQQTTVFSLLNRAQTFIMLKRFEEAIADCDLALNMEEDNYKAHGRKAIALHALDRFERAKEDFEWCLEKQPTDKRFQQLFDECQRALDSKNFVDLELIISSYNGVKSVGNKFSLAKGGIFQYASSSKSKRTSTSFEGLDSLSAHLTKHISASLACIHIEQSTIDEPLMQFFRSMNPITVRSAFLRLYDVNCSKPYFDELLGGTLFRPINIWFAQRDDEPYDNHFFPALNSRKLAAINGAQMIDVISHDKSKKTVPFTGQPLLDIDSLLAFLSTEYPGIPPHIRRSPTGGKHPDNTIDQNGSIGQALEMIRSFEGRSVDIDLRYLGFGKLPELINKCKQSFLGANRPIALSFIVRFMMLKDKLDPRDLTALSPIFEEGGEAAIQNGIGEQLKFSVGPCSDPTIYALMIERTMCP